MLKKIFSQKKGATAIEYGLIAALISVAIIGSLSAIGTKKAGSVEILFKCAGYAIDGDNLKNNPNCRKMFGIDKEGI